MSIVADGAGVRVMAERCETCIFHPGNRMRLAPGRVASMVAACLADREAGNIPCHETLDEPLQAICRGFYDAHGDKIALLQVADRLGFLVEWTRP